jgi:RNA polymerase sigma-70 factor (ECF subfamily)
MMQPATDSDLLQRALAGDEDAFAALYQRRQGAVYRFALHMTGSTAAAEDVTQETFLALLKSGARFDPSRGALESFLYGIARNQARKRLDNVREGELKDGAEEDTGADAGVLEELTRREAVELVRSAVLSLPPQYREAVVLCDLQESSYEEAAAALDCPVGTVRSRLSRARAMLARKLKGSAILLAGSLL